MNNHRWGVGSNEHQHRHDQPSQESASPVSPRTPLTGTTGRVTWNRATLDFDLIPRSDQDRAVFRFRKSLPDLIWNTAALEGNTFTLPEVRTLLDGVTVGGKKQEEADQILALSEGMEAMLTRVENDNFALSKSVSDEVHAFVARHEAIEAGWFRGDVSLLTPTSGLADPRERALAYFSSAVRTQFYFDGNKRTARILMSGELLSNGFESVNIPYARALEFNQALDALFKTDDATSLMAFLISCAPQAQ